MTELCEVVITAPHPEWLFRLTRALVADGLCVSLIVDRVRAEGHPYQVPGISARPITDGSPEYLQWIANETSFDHG